MASRHSVGSLTQHMIDSMDPADRKSLGLKTSEEIAAKLAGAAEKEIQNTVEAYLRHLGYWPRSPAYLDGKKPPSGWYFHVHSAKKNPILLDLVVMHCTGAGRYVEIELKTATGKLRPMQQVLVDQGAQVFHSAKDAMEFLKRWHESN